MLRPDDRMLRIAGHEQDVIVVKYHITACPYCGCRKGSVRGRQANLRYHKCPACNRAFKSLEVPPDAAAIQDP